uniref:Protein kinase domain-containing protein n=1 Tax=Macrostomum lignano TaxID=282301 RepID=A0A1I8F8E2_9PLAT
SQAYQQATPPPASQGLSTIDANLQPVRLNTSHALRVKATHQPQPVRAYNNRCHFQPSQALPTIDATSASQVINNRRHLHPVRLTNNRRHLQPVRLINTSAPTSIQSGLSTIGATTSQSSLSTIDATREVRLIQQSGANFSAPSQSGLSIIGATFSRSGLIYNRRSFSQPCSSTIGANSTTKPVKFSTIGANSTASSQPGFDHNRANFHQPVKLSTIGAMYASVSLHNLAPLPFARQAYQQSMPPEISQAYQQTGATSSKTARLINTGPAPPASQALSSIGATATSGTHFASNGKTTTTAAAILSTIIALQTMIEGTAAAFFDHGSDEDVDKSWGEVASASGSAAAASPREEATTAMSVSSFQLPPLPPRLCSNSRNSNLHIQQRLTISILKDIFTCNQVICNSSNKIFGYRLAKHAIGCTTIATAAAVVPEFQSVSLSQSTSNTVIHRAGSRTASRPTSRPASRAGSVASELAASASSPALGSLANSTAARPDEGEPAAVHLTRKLIKWGADLTDLLLEGHEPRTLEYRDHGLWQPTGSVTSMRRFAGLRQQQQQPPYSLQSSQVCQLIETTFTTGRCSLSHYNMTWPGVHAQDAGPLCPIKQCEMNDPLQTLYQLHARPNASRHCRIMDTTAISAWGDWRPPSAMLLSNQPDRPELASQAIAQMGDTLADRWLNQQCSLQTRPHSPPTLWSARLSSIERLQCHPACEMSLDQPDWLSQLRQYYTAGQLPCQLSQDQQLRGLLKHLLVIHLCVSNNSSSSIEISPLSFGDVNSYKQQQQHWQCARTLYRVCLSILTLVPVCQQPPPPPPPPPQQHQPSSPPGTSGSGGGTVFDYYGAVQSSGQQIPDYQRRSELLSKRLIFTRRRMPHRLLAAALAVEPSAFLRACTGRAAASAFCDTTTQQQRIPRQKKRRQCPVLVLRRLIITTSSASASAISLHL